MAKWLKTLLWTLVGLFIIYYIYTRPEAAADFVNAIFNAFDSLMRFFSSLASG